MVSLAQNQIISIIYNITNTRDFILHAMYILHEHVFAAKF